MPCIIHFSIQNETSVSSNRVKFPDFIAVLTMMRLEGAKIMISDNTKKREHKNPVSSVDNISRRIQPEESVAGHRDESLRRTAEECLERAKLNLQKHRHLMPACIVLTHAGQLAMLRRLAGSPVPPENFVFAAISPTNVGTDQPLPVSPDKDWLERP